MKHQSGSISAWKQRKAAYQQRSGPVSNPGDLRDRAKVRRQNAERRVRKEAK